MTTRIASLISALGPGVANHLWQSTVFAAAMALVCLALKRNAARVRYGVWLAASVKFLVPFSLLIGLGGLLPRQHAASAVTPAGIYSVVDAAGMPFSDALRAPANNVIRAHRGWWERTMTVLPEAVAAVWLCGVAGVLLFWLERWRELRPTLRQARVAEVGREVEILRRVERAAGTRQQMTLLLSEELIEPGVLGVRKPRLIWPVQLSERLEDEHIETILAHELVHVRRRDNVTVMLHMIAEAVFWFHPLVWWMESRMVEERERACDEAVIAGGGSPEVYAEGLLKAVRFCLESPMVCVAGISGADLSRRVRSIMAMKMTPLSVAKKLALAALAMAMVVGPVIFGQMGPDGMGAESKAPKLEVVSAQAPAAQTVAAPQGTSGAQRPSSAVAPSGAQPQATVPQPKITVEQAQADMANARSQQQAAEARVTQLGTAIAQAQVDVDRYAELMQKSIVSIDFYKEKTVQLKARKADLTKAREQVVDAQDAVRRAEFRLAFFQSRTEP